MDLGWLCQCRFINCNKCATWVGDIWWWRRLKSPPSAQLFYEPKIHLKKSFLKSKIKKKKKDKEEGEGKIKVLKLSHIFKNVLAGSSGLCSGVWKSLSCVQLFATPRTAHGILQARIMEWEAFPFSRGSSQPRDQTQVSCIAGGFFISWATREALCSGNFFYFYKNHHIFILLIPALWLTPSSYTYQLLSESEVAQSCPTLSNPMDCSLQAPSSMGFSRQEYWSGVPLPSPISTIKIVNNLHYKSPILF